MDEYTVILTPDAEDSLNELDDYITFGLMAADTAMIYLRDIRKEISSLCSAPKRFRLIEREPWHSRGVSRMNAKNFAVFFIVVEQDREVYVLNVVYQKRDLPKVLAAMFSYTGEL